MFQNSGFQKVCLPSQSDEMRQLLDRIFKNQSSAFQIKECVASGSVKITTYDHS